MNYFLFYGDNFYPDGGVKDGHRIDESIVAIKNYFHAMHDAKTGWAHIAVIDMPGFLIIQEWNKKEGWKDANGH